MIRLTDQYIWNFIFFTFFVVLIIMGTIILETEAYRDYTMLTLFDLLLMSLASFRLVRMVVYDTITKWFREQFYDAKTSRGSVTLHKPKSGPRRTIADLLSCPWCFGCWAGAVITFCYLLTPYAFFPVLFLAISGVASLLQLYANQLGHKAELLKNQNERGF